MERVHTIRLRPGEQDRLLAGHPWVYQNELEGWPPDAAPGDLVDLHDSQGHFLGRGYLNPRTTLAVRVLARGRVPVDQEFFLARIRQAMALRERFMGDRVAYRVVHGEADGLPGLVVDRYDDAVAIQLLTAGMDRRRELILTAVEEVLRPRTIVARNDSPMREREGLPRERAVLRGQIPPDPTVTIYGLDVVVDLLEGQKTGLFLDQIDNYPLIERMTAGAKPSTWSSSILRRSSRRTTGYRKPWPATRRSTSGRCGFSAPARFWSPAPAPITFPPNCFAACSGTPPGMSAGRSGWNAY